jgi:transcriptional regulator
MYVPHLFRESDRERCFELIEAYPFGTLIVKTERELEIAHAPLLLDRERGQLRAHLARANPIARLLASKPEVLVEIRGPDAYVSPGWYEHPEQQVPTWNYLVVHVRGRCSPPIDDGELVQLLRDLSTRFEATVATPWTLEKLEPALLHELLPQIAGFTIEIVDLVAKLKLSQNRSAEDRRRVQNAHARSDDPSARALARWMRD